MQVKIVVHEAEEGGFWAEVPALPGCASQGETMDELLANMREAIQAWLRRERPRKSRRPASGRGSPGRLNVCEGVLGQAFCRLLKRNGWGCYVSRAVTTFTARPATGVESRCLFTATATEAWTAASVDEARRHRRGGGGR